MVEGDGPAIEKGRLVAFDYLGEVWKGDKPFDESYSKEPITFPVGVGSVIPAWDEGLVGVKEGSRVLIIAPPDKAYGKDGQPPSIPGNATLAFVSAIESGYFPVVGRTPPGRRTPPSARRIMEVARVVPSLDRRVTGLPGVLAMVGGST